MKLELDEDLNPEIWDKSLAIFPDGAEILQSSVWAGISEGVHVRRFAWLEGERVIVLGQIIENMKAGFKFWYIPRGPILLGQDDGAWEKVLSDLKARAAEHKVTALRYEPEGWEENIEFGILQRHIQPPKSLFLDLNKTEEELLAEMHPKTRYNIRLAEKRVVTVLPGTVEDIELFYNLMKTTTARDGFRGHGLAHYRRLVEKSQGAIQLWFAKREGKILAAGIFSFYNGRAVYMHGASADEGREHMAPYLLQWKMILKAKAEGCRFYDFYGIDEKKWPGVTRFKRGFGGFEKNYPGTFITVINRGGFRVYTILINIYGHIRRFF